MKTLRFMSFAAGLALLFTACTGPAGPEGEPGEDGANGNANVVASFYTPYAFPTPWNANGTTNYYATLSDANLTSSIQANGATEVFLTIDANGTTWTALPFTYYGGVNPNYIWAYSTNVGQITITWTSEGGSLGSDPNTIYGGVSCGFKVIDIASSVMKRHPNTNWKNYYEVMSVVNAEKPNSGIQVQTIAPAPVQSVK
jgi:hypothetical protein